MMMVVVSVVPGSTIRSAAPVLSTGGKDRRAAALSGGGDHVDLPDVCLDLLTGLGLGRRSIRRPSGHRSDYGDPGEQRRRARDPGYRPDLFLGPMRLPRSGLVGRFSYRGLLRLHRRLAVGLDFPTGRGSAGASTWAGDWTRRTLRTRWSDARRGPIPCFRHRRRFPAVRQLLLRYRSPTEPACARLPSS